MPINPTDNDTTGYRTLAQLRQALMRRMGYAPAQINNPPPGVAELCNELLQDANRMLVRRFPALRTERWFSWTLAAGERFYSLTANDEQSATPAVTKQIDPYSITWAGYELDNTRYPLVRGIPEAAIAQDVSSRPTHYDIRQAIELWPAPAATEGTLLLRGHWRAGAFTADTDTPDIDDEAVFLLALANLKAHHGKADAQNYVTQMEVHLAKLVAGTHGTARYIPGASQGADYVYTLPVPSEPFA